MKAVNPVLIACLITWTCFALSMPRDNKEKEYPVCDTPVCIQRAKLINESLNTSVDPCEDFYSYACGGWMKSHPVPNDKSTMDSFTILSDELKDTLRDLLSNLTLVGENQTIIDKAALFYNSCVAVPDLDDRRDVMFDILNASGLGDWPIIGQEANISEVSSNITDVIIKTGMSSILSFGVSRDIRELSTHVIQLDQIDFSWVGRNQMINQTTNYSRPMIAAYKTIMQVTMKFIKPNLSDDNITELSERLLAFEGQLANLTAPPEERRDIKKIYHRTTMEELHNNFTYIPIHVLLKRVFKEVNLTLADNETIELYALDYYTKLNNFLECADPDTLYNYAGLKVMLRWAAAASEAFRNATFKLVKVQSGVSVRKPRWELCIGSVKAAMPEIIGKLYVQHKFSEEAKREVEDLAKRLMSVFNKTLQTTDWMDNTTRSAAEKKLTKMEAKIGYPDWINNMTYLEELYRFFTGKENFQINDLRMNMLLETYACCAEYQFFKKRRPQVPQLPLNTSYLEAVYLVSVNSGKNSLLKLRMPYDKESEWIVGPAVVNAFYSPSSNEMVYPSAILQGVFYEHGLPRSLNFGAIGMVVGHEMTHGFDDTGKQFDADGALKEWWSNRTSAEFKSRAKCFEYQYGNITDKKANMTLNAKNTLGENIADNGGLRLVFEEQKYIVGGYLDKKAVRGCEEPAYKNFLEEECQSDGTRLKGLEEFSGKKLFFVANAMAWCSVSRPQYLKLLIQYDPHSPSQYRVNLPMSNMPDFSKTFNCPANSTMNRKERCTLW